MDTAEKKPRIKAPKNKLDDMLIVAATNGETDTVVSLISQGANINATSRYFKDSPLMLAAERGHMDIINILITTPGILINQTNRNLYTALMSAARFARADAVKVLLSVDGILVNLQNEYGHTALILAVQSKKTDTVAALLEMPNIDITIKNKQGRTALEELLYKPVLDVKEKVAIKTLAPLPPIQINQKILALLRCREMLLRSRMPLAEPAPQETTDTLDTVLSKPVKSVTFSRDKESMKKPRPADVLKKEAEIAVQPKQKCVKRT
jgi:hypothetical protein